MLWRQCKGVGLPPKDQPRATVTLLLRCALAAHFQVTRGVHGKRKRLDTRPRNTNYYDVLQVTPKATQAQVKDAYYKLSKKYHPDQYRGDEDPAKKFREITEAYEVLGNFHQRKMYDRGLLGVTPAATPAEAEAYASKFYESRRKRGQVPTSSGRTPIYDFDEWAKTHYQTTRQRREETKIRYEQLLRDRVVDAEERRTQSIVSLITLSGIMLIVYYTFSRTHDVPKNVKKSDTSTSREVT